MSGTHSNVAPSASLKWAMPPSERARSTVANLEQREVDRVGREMASERALTFTSSKTGEYVSGRLTGVASLASGRFAMIEDGLGFRLVPWQPILENRIGQFMSGIQRDSGGIDWEFGRKRGLGL